MERFFLNDQNLDLNTGIKSQIEVIKTFIIILMFGIAIADLCEGEGNHSMSSMRSKSMIYDWRQSTVYAATNDGYILKLDQDLNFLDISERLDDFEQIVKVDFDALFVYALDMSGRVSRWNKQTLALEGFDEPYNSLPNSSLRKQAPEVSYNHDQTEWLHFSEDRYIYQMSNEIEPKILKRMGPFDFRAKQIIWARWDLAFLLTEEGEIRRFELSYRP